MENLNRPSAMPSMIESESLFDESDISTEWEDIEAKYDPRFAGIKHRPMRRIEEWRDLHHHGSDDLDAFFAELDREDRRLRIH